MLLRKGGILAACLLALTTAACDEISGSDTDADNNLVFTREDGSRVGFDNRINVWCGDWEDGEVGVRTVHVMGGRPLGGNSSFWYVRAVVADVSPNQPLVFPNSYIWNDPDDADVFVYDQDDDNELSSQESDSEGSITFQSLSCDKGGEVRFTLDAILDSEVGLDPVRVTGSFSGRVGNNPF